jgi:hypothetical protein
MVASPLFPCGGGNTMRVAILRDALQSAKADCNVPQDEGGVGLTERPAWKTNGSLSVYP